MEWERIFKFLVDLPPKLDQVKVQVLDKEPLPYLREVFAYTQGEEIHQGVTLGKFNNQTPESFTSAVIKPNS